MGDGIYSDILSTLWTPEQYDSLYARFFWVFPEIEGHKRIYLSGNHDIGWHIDSGGTELVAMFKEYQ